MLRYLSSVLLREDFLLFFINSIAFLLSKNNPLGISVKFNFTEISYDMDGFYPNANSSSINNSSLMGILKPYILGSVLIVIS